MISVLINWFYLSGSVFLLGFGVRAFLERFLHTSLSRADSLLMAGLIAATVYAQIFSFFGGVGALANLFLILLCAGIALWQRRQIALFLKTIWAESSAAKRIFVAALCLFWAYCTSRGYLLYDSDLYHGQSIRWIEEYGIVKGLGNLHERFAYNSSSFALSALYSMKFVFGRSLHTLSGFFALVLSLTCLRAADCVKRKRLLWADYARIAAIYYLTIICDEVVSPSSDYFIMCTIFYLVIRWLEELERPKQETAPYCLLCVVGVYALTLKLTAGLILILLIKPAAALLRQKNWPQIGLYLGMGLCVALPWMLRTVWISGYLLYPCPGLDLFSVDWKMGAQGIETDAAQIIAWARGAWSNVPLHQWFPAWFQKLAATEKLMILADLCGFLFFAVLAIRVFVKKSWKELDALLVLAAVGASYLFWQFSAPMVRYGYAYVLLFAALCGGWLLCRIGRDRIVFFCIVCYGCYKLFMVGGQCWSVRLQEYYLWQQDYGVYELEEKQLDGQTIYVPVYGDRSGYEFFPAAPVLNEIELRGEDLSDGFRRK